MKKIPLRMCVATKEKLPKREMFRIVVVNNEAIYDPSSKLNGKGAYLKKDKDVIKLAKNNKILDRVLNVKVKDSLYEELIDKIE